MSAAPDPQDPQTQDPLQEDQVYVPQSTRSTHFVFHHPLFGLPEAVFRTQGDQTQVLEVKLGENRASLPLSTVRLEFPLDAPGKADSEMMEKVEKGLKYVKEIRPGDSIPRELLDGTASWSIEPKHLAIARGRVMVQLMSWAAGEEAMIVDPAQLQQIVEDPTTQKRVDEAIDQICRQLKLSAGQRQTVLTRIDGLIRELAYIEALREYAGRVHGVSDKLNRFSRLYHGDKVFWPEIQRMKSLIRKPMEQISTYFTQADSRTSGIVSSIRNYNATINLIRDIRDEIHFALMNWDVYVQMMAELPLERSRAYETKLRSLYGFLARTFPETREWPLFTQFLKGANPKADLHPQKPAPAAAKPA